MKDLGEITKKMVNNPDEWPQWPFLPIKRWSSAGFSEMAYLYGDSVWPLKVYFGNIWSLEPNNPTIFYEDIEAFLDDPLEIRR